jgi:hypothetical protein
MAFNALFEFVFNIDDFLNIDLHNQGLYRIKMSLKYEYKS